MRKVQTGINSLQNIDLMVPKKSVSRRKLSQFFTFAVKLQLKYFSQSFFTYKIFESFHRIFFKLFKNLVEKSFPSL